MPKKKREERREMAVSRVHEVAGSLFCENKDTAIFVAPTKLGEGIYSRLKGSGGRVAVRGSTFLGHCPVSP